VQELGAIGRAGEQRLEPFRSQELQRVRVKRQHDRWTTDRSHMPARFRHECRVAPMDAVEVANG
jgi:hypothetical protein